MSTFIIGEAGSTHFGSLDLAYLLIEKAKWAGCDAVKFQLFNETLYVKDTPDFGGYKNINKLMESLILPREWVPKLRKRCHEVGIEFMATPFDEEAIKLLDDVGVQRLKIAAFESSDPRFLRLCAETGLPLIISLGAMNLSAWQIYDIIADVVTDPSITFLHCVSKYPTPPELASLGTIQSLKDEYYRWDVGYSDHTLDVFTPSLAVALGATVIEKHFTLSKVLDNPDAPNSLEPEELKEMVRLIRETEKKMSLRGHATHLAEQNNCSRSIFAVSDLEEGAVLTKENITTARPYFPGNIHASKYDEVIGKVLAHSVKAGEAVKNVRN